MMDTQEMWNKSYIKGGHVSLYIDNSFQFQVLLQKDPDTVLHQLQSGPSLTLHKLNLAGTCDLCCDKSSFSILHLVVSLGPVTHQFLAFVLETLSHGISTVTKHGKWSYESKKKGLAMYFTWQLPVTLLRVCSYKKSLEISSESHANLYVEASVLKLDYFV